MTRQAHKRRGEGLWAYLQGIAVGRGRAAGATRLRCNLKAERKGLGRSRGCLGLRNNTYGLLISFSALQDLVCKAV